MQISGSGPRQARAGPYRRRDAAGAGACRDHTHQMSAGRALWLVSLAAVLANASWFSATAVVPALQRQWGLTSAGAAWLVIVVQVGFVVGSIGAALLNLPDRLEPRRLIAAAAVIAGAANGGLLLAHGLATAVPMRFLVGVALAGVYAPGVRLVATYFTLGRGMATGVVVGALTLGSGTPNLVRGVGGAHWQVTIVVTSALALVAAIVVSPVRAGPGQRHHRRWTSGLPRARSGVNARSGW
jgi:predicted MFS family arabinose efflux permease